MATIGLRDIYYSKITRNQQTNKWTYATPVRMAKAISAELSINYATAALYADDALDDEAKEFSSGEIKLNINDLSPQVQTDLFGQTLGEDGISYANTADAAPYVAVGFRARKTGGKYRYIWLYRVNFAPPADAFQTKGDGIEYKTPEITGTITAREDGNWKADYVGAETEDIAKAWFTAVKEPADSTGT